MCERVDWIQLAHGTTKLLVLFNMMIVLGAHKLLETT